MLYPNIRTYINGGFCRNVGLQQQLYKMGPVLLNEELERLSNKNPPLLEPQGTSRLQNSIPLDTTLSQLSLS
jgi:hypothetical protein